MGSTWDKIKDSFDYLITGQFFVNLHGQWLLRKLDKPHRPFKYYFIRADKNLPNNEYFQAKHDRETAKIIGLAEEVIDDPTPPSPDLVDFVKDMMAKDREEQLHRQQKTKKIVARTWLSATAALFICVAIATNTFSVKDHLTGLISILFPTNKVLLTDPLGEVNEIIYHAPSYVPEGYGLFEKKQLSEDTFLTEYKNADGELIQLNQRMSEEHTIDIEQFESENILINNVEGVFYTNAEGRNVLIWIQNGYRYTIRAFVDQNTMVEMAESIKAVE